MSDIIRLKFFGEQNAKEKLATQTTNIFHVNDGIRLTLCDKYFFLVSVNVLLVLAVIVVVIVIVSFCSAKLSFVS